MITVEKTEHYAQLTVSTPDFKEETATELEKNVVALYKEGFTNMIFDCATVTDMTTKGLALIGKVHRLLSKESGMLVIVNQDPDITDALKEADMEGLVILPTPEEAIDAIFMNELENEFREEEDDEFDMEDGFGVENAN